MEVNKSYVIITVIIITFIVGAIGVYNRHIEKSYLVLNNKIKEAGKNCYLDKKCNDTFTLQDLFDNNYLSEAIDPVTKEDVDKNTCLKYENNEIIFCK